MVSRRTWITEIASTSNATVHPLGKGMLMARASLAANAAYCAVGRAADRYGLRMQWRSSDGAGTGFQEQFGDYGTNRPVARENWHFVQLTVDRVDGGRDSRCQMSISKNGKDWEPFGEARVFQNIALSTIGVATSSNGGFNADNARSYSGENPFFFVGLRRRAGGGPMADVNLAALVRSGIGGSSAPFELRLQGPEEGCAAPRDLSHAAPPPR